jgi:UrcA family protein
MISKRASHFSKPQSAISRVNANLPHRYPNGRVAHMRRSNMKAIITAFAIASLAVPAVAQQSLSVKTGDLNLASEQGQKVLALRIHRAAAALCASDVVDRLPEMQRAERRCIEDAKATAVAAVERTTGVRSASR